MAAYTVDVSKHATLVAGTADTVTVHLRRFESVEVTNRDGADEITYTLDGTVPVADADDTWVLPAAVAARSHPSPGDGVDVVVTLISVGAPKYSVVKVSQS